MLMYLILVGPAILLALYAQWRVSSAYSQMSQVPARMAGADAARRILDSEGLYDIPIEETYGHLTDHYDPSTKVVRLSSDVYHGHSMASVGIAAHEVGHAIQDARHYAPLVLRNLAVPAAGFGASISSVVFSIAFMLLIMGAPKFAGILLLLGILGYSLTVVFQLINLPVEFDASARAKNQLVALGIVSPNELSNVSSVLNAAALTYVAATLTSVMTLIDYIIRYAALSHRDE